MRTIITAFIMIAALLMNAVCVNGAIAQDAVPQAPNSVAVYYFHTDYRCVNCHNMEKWTKEVIENDFADAVKSGKLVLRIINTDTKGNEHYMTDYKLYTKSVVVALVKNGKEVKFDNLAKVWDYLKNADKFKAYIKDEISKYLKEAS